jgi:alpha-D-ribose 1-methylphosphonate 5-triphosphate synthase subunit PhnH
MNWDRVHDGRTTFLACMHAMCSPGTPIELPQVPQVSEYPELDGAAAILLALLDHDLLLGVSGGAAARRVAEMAVRETGAVTGDVGCADWVLVHGPAADAISRAHRGSRRTPEKGATIVIAAAGEALPLSMVGPGIADRATAFVPLESVAVHAFTATNANPPSGVDLLVVTPECLIGIPRSVSVHHGAG